MERTVLTQITEAPEWPSKTFSARRVFRFHTWTKPFPDLEALAEILITRYTAWSSFVTVQSKLTYSQLLYTGFKITGTSVINTGEKNSSESLPVMPNKVGSTPREMGSNPENIDFVSWNCFCVDLGS